MNWNRRAFVVGGALVFCLSMGCAGVSSTSSWHTTPVPVASVRAEPTPGSTSTDTDTVEDLEDTGEPTYHVRATSSPLGGDEIDECGSDTRLPAPSDVSPAPAPDPDARLID